MRRMRMCFTEVFFCFFPSATKMRTVLGNGWTDFHETFTNDSGENGVCIAIPKWGLGPQLIFGGLKTTHCALGGDAWRMTQKITLCWLIKCVIQNVTLFPSNDSNFVQIYTFIQNFWRIYVKNTIFCPSVLALLHDSATAYRLHTSSAMGQYGRPS